MRWREKAVARRRYPAGRPRRALPGGRRVAVRALRDGAFDAASRKPDRLDDAGTGRAGARQHESELAKRSRQYPGEEARMMKAGLVVVGAAAILNAGSVGAQAWSPQRNVELIVPASAGGSLDTTGRMVTRLWGD